MSKYSQDNPKVYIFNRMPIFQQLQTGMVILGCIKNIRNFALEVELPGLCFASVPITEISDPFTKHLNQQLENSDPNVSFPLTMPACFYTLIADFSLSISASCFLLAISCPLR